MIASLTGKVTYKKAPNLIIECNSIGYEVEATMSVFTAISDEDKDIKIFTHLAIRDDAHILFGFSSISQRDAFRTLIKVNGVGPKLGLLILSGMTESELAKTIQSENVAMLVKLPGIGKKTAERLVMELKDKFIATESSSDDIFHKVTDERSDAIEALISLGYKPMEAEKMVKSAYQEGLDSEAIIRKSLQAKMS